MIIKTLKVIKNNWKKSVFFSCVAICGANYLNNKIIEHNIMRDYCKEALRFGNDYLKADQKARHLTVILNPTANTRKSRSLYDKYCAPLFHLAGIRVSLVVTESEGQARDLMQIMDNTDAVVIAGGNGTVHEAITGLLRREDESTAVHRFPIGIIPVGKRNTIAYSLNKFSEKKLTNAEILAETAMNVIRELIKPIDVMKIEGKRGNPVFALEELNYGIIRDTITNVDKYWYFGSKLKPYLAFFINSFKSLSSNEKIGISYSEPCTGCSKCYKRFQSNNITNNASEPTTRWWHIFLSRNLTNNKPSNQSKVDLSSIINERCDQWSDLNISAANLIVKNTNECKLQIIIHSQPLTRNQFISDGVKLFNCQPLPQTTGSVEVIQAKDINLELPNHTSDVGMADVETDSTTDSIANSWLSIDTESYETQTVKIMLLPNKLNMYLK